MSDLIGNPEDRFSCENNLDRIAILVLCGKHPLKGKSCFFRQYRSKPNAEVSTFMFTLCILGILHVFFVS